MKEKLRSKKWDFEGFEEIPNEMNDVLESVKATDCI